MPKEMMSTCRACSHQEFVIVEPHEAAAGISGALQHNCKPCGKSTWHFVGEANRKSENLKDMRHAKRATE